MTGLKLFGPAVLATVLLSGSASAAPDAPDAVAVRAAAGRAVPLIESTAATYPSKRGCFSCHHQTMAVLALTLARDRAFKVDGKVVEAQLDLTLADLQGAEESYRQGKGQGGGATRAGYALWALELGGRKPDSTTSAVSSFLLQRDALNGYWRTSSNRPPSEFSSFTSTYVALRALATFADADQQEAVRERREKAREWLGGAEAKDTEDRVFRLWALKASGADAGAVGSAAKQLRDTQREDGSWSQLDGQPGDAYATGSALAALHLAGGLPTGDPAYRRGLKALIDSQLPDGSWLVVSRSKAFQPYFESGFPHGKDQFISMAATGWATAALLLALPAAP